MKKGFKSFVLLLIVSIAVSSTAITTAQAAEWQTNTNGWWYQEDDGTYPADSWKNIHGAWYHFDNYGYMQTGWFYDGTHWFYLNESGAMQTGWQVVNGYWYYFNDSGYMQTGWFHDGAHWSYLNESGALQTGWYRVGSTWYYSDGSGYMQTGWFHDGAHWFYLNESGAMQTGWQVVNGCWYYFNGSGYMQTGWFNDGAHWFYLNTSGAMQTGWYRVGSTWYYFNGSGYMQTGWLYDGADWYYLNESGAMMTNQWIGDCWVDASGRWDPSAEPPIRIQEYEIDLGGGQTTTVRGFYNHAYENQVFELLNAYRVENGKEPLIQMDSFVDAAAIRGKEQAILFDHQRPNGESCFSVLDEARGENIALGHLTPEQVMSGWMTSPGHNENMLRDSFHKIGISCFFEEYVYDDGYVSYIPHWVQLFG